MFNNKIKLYKKICKTILLMVLVSTSACTKNFDKVNTPADRISTGNMNIGLIGQAFALSQYQGFFGTPYIWQQAQNLFADLYCQYYATIADYFSSDQYVDVVDWPDLTWWEFYSVPAPQLLEVEQFTASNGLVVDNAIAKIWKVAIYHRMTDYWGPIIYSNFGNGKTSVMYDKQQDVYHAFFNVLDDAVTTLKAHPGEFGFGTNDLVFSGSADKWLVFANSLRLRLAMRLAYVEPTLAQQEAEKAVADGVMMNNSDNANIAVNAISYNSWGDVIAWGEFRMSATMQSILVGYNDPRVSVYFNQAVNGGGYKGCRNGLPVTDREGLSDLYSVMGTKWWKISLGGSNPPIRVMCAAEVYFLRAEGALRGWNMGGTPVDLYNQGIRTSIPLEAPATTSAQVEAYIISTNTPAPVSDALFNTPPASTIPVLYQGGASFETQLEQIITQKWIAIFPDGWESWSERRRTGYPKGYPIIQSLNNDVPADKQMRRLMFTPFEISNNAVAVDSARLLLGGPDNCATRLWWDVKPE